VIGRAAHGSRYDIGVDAITNAGLLLTELARLETEILPGRSHRLLGRPSVHASKIEGGTGMSTYPDRCKLAIERRTIPGETAEDAAREIELLCAGLEAKRNEFHATVTLAGGQPPSDVAEDSPIVRALESGLSAARHPVRMEGLSAWTDAALLNGAGIPAICFGPGDIALAHSHEEFVEVGEIEIAVKVLTATIRNWLA
jgi:acetylornithine deacetylase